MGNTVVHMGDSQTTDSISTDSEDSMYTAFDDIIELDTRTSLVTRNRSAMQNGESSQRHGSRSYDNAYQYQQLQEAFRERCKGIFKAQLYEWLERGQIDLNYKYEGGKTVLDLARRMAVHTIDILEEVVKNAMKNEDRELINFVMNVDQRSSSLFSNDMKYENIRTLLCKKRIDVMAATFRDGKCMFHIAARYASLDLMRYMLCNDSFRVCVNSKDVTGMTPLHYAASYRDFEMVSCLVRYGASITDMNEHGEPAFAALSPTHLERLLDKCVTFQSRLDTNFKITFNLDIFYGKNVQRDKKKINEPVTPALLYISRRLDLRHLLQHPTLATLIQLKWHNLVFLFYSNCILYLLFLSQINVYVLQFNLPTNKTANPPTNKTSNPPPDSKYEESSQKVLQLMNLFFLILCLIILITREVVQFVIKPVKYLSNLENWLEIVLFAITGAMLSDYKNDATLSAATVFLSWIGLVLLGGRHPKTATSMQMLKTVSLNYVKFLRLYSILIAAFAFSFYVLMECENKTEEKCLFDTVFLSIFKSIVMLTGEYDMSSVPFTTNSTAKYVLFLVFVVMIAIVLLNLLNGLAVSDTQKIISDAELLGYESQLKYVSHMENILLESKSRLGNIMSRIFGGWLDGKIITFYNYEIEVFPYRRNRMTANPRKGHSHRYEMSTEDVIVERAREILVKISNEFARGENALVMKETMKKVEELQNEMTALKDELIVKMEAIHSVVTQLRCNEQQSTGTEIELNNW